MTGLDAPRPPALARAGIDRAADERADEGLLARLRADPTTRVVAVHGDRALIAATGTHLHTVRPADIETDVEWAFLGRDAAGTAVLLAVSAADAPPPIAAPETVPAAEVTPAPEVTPAQWGALRAVGGELDAVDAGVLVEAVSLGRWLVDAPFCPACGTRTAVRSAGWSRRCPACAREHFPRTDPAVIVAVRSPDDTRLLLGKNALWADRNVYSTFAGFVEAGESLESTIIREIREEASVTVTDLHYRASQAWPYPRSLMLGFHATAAVGSHARADGVEIIDVRWFDRSELRAALRGEGEVSLPGTASIARRLIVDWVEGAA